MKKLLIFTCMAVVPSLLASGSVFAQTAEESFYQQWVDYRDGQISVSFHRTPVVVALHAIREKTGVQFHVPSAAGDRLLSLRLVRERLEPAVQSLLSSIGFRNFALMYDEEGRPWRAVVLGGLSPENAQPANAGRAAEDAQGAAEPLSADERDRLQSDLQRWENLKQEERGRVEDRLKTLPASPERDQLVAEYGRIVLGIKK